MATINNMRRIFIHSTSEYCYAVPIEMADEFYRLLNDFLGNKTEEKKQLFLTKFGHYQHTKDLVTLELYVKDQGIYDRRRDNL